MKHGWGTWCSCGALECFAVCCHCSVGVFHYPCSYLFCTFFISEIFRETSSKILIEMNISLWKKARYRICFLFLTDTTWIPRQWTVWCGQSKCWPFDLFSFVFEIVAKNMYTYVCTFVRVYVYWLYACLCVFMFVFLCVDICARISTCICIYMCIRIHVCNGVVQHTRMHAHAHTRQIVLWPEITSKRNGQHSSRQGCFEQRYFHVARQAISSSLDIEQSWHARKEASWFTRSKVDEESKVDVERCAEGD